MKTYSRISILFFILFFTVGIKQAYAFDISQCEQQENEATCRNRLVEIEKEIKKLEGNIQDENKNQASLSGEITKLNTEIKKHLQILFKKPI
jgi:peptidoglycan hydrolase CwlO-like protein